MTEARSWQPESSAQAAVQSCTDAPVLRWKSCGCEACDCDLPAIFLARDRFALWVTATAQAGSDTLVLALQTRDDVQRLADDIGAHMIANSAPSVQTFRETLLCLWESEPGPAHASSYSVN